MDGTQEKQAMLNDLLDRLYNFILGSEEFQRLYQCTQTRDEFVNSGDDNRTNRGVHSIDVSANAGILTTQLLTKGENRELTPEEYSQVRLAEVIGISHDLGHTPKGHAAELILKKDCKTGFNHAKYSGVVFESLYKRFLAGLQPDERALLNDYNILETVVMGVQGHSRWYSSDADKIKIGEERKEPEKLAQIPLIAVRIADGVSFAPADLYDLANSDRADGGKGRVITPEMILGVLQGKTTVISDPNYPSQDMLAGVTPATKIFEEIGFNYQEIIDSFANSPTRMEAVAKLQAAMIEELAQEALRGREAGEEVTIVDRTDELKTLRAMAKSDTPPNPNDWFDSFIEIYEYNKWTKLTPEQKDELRSRFLNDKGGLKSFQEALNDLQDEFRRRCPICSVALEAHDELVYHQMFDRGEEGTKVLGNEEPKTRAVLTKMFGEYVSEWDTLNDEQKKNLEEMITIYQTRMPPTDPKLTEAQIYAVIMIQRKTNSDIEDAIKKMDEDKSKTGTIAPVPETLGVDSSGKVKNETTPEPVDGDVKTSTEDNPVKKDNRPETPDDSPIPERFVDDGTEKEETIETTKVEESLPISENTNKSKKIKEIGYSGRDTAAETLDATGVDIEFNYENTETSIKTMQQDLQPGVYKPKIQEEEVNLE